MIRTKKFINENTYSFFTPSNVISLGIIVGVLLTVVFANHFAPFDPNKVDITQTLLPPSFNHLLGTDNAGRDFFSRLLYGGRLTLLAAFGVTGIATVIGVPLGLFCGYYGGLLDNIVMRIWDINLAFPTLLLAFIFVACFGCNIGNVVLALSIIFLPLTTRFSRSLVLVEKNKTYVEAAKVLGYTNRRIIFRHIFPNCIQSIAVYLTMLLANAILDLAALSFLGLGVQPPTADWGAMLEENKQYLLTSPLLAIAPGLMIILVIVSINILSDGLNMYWDPKQRKLPKSLARSLKNRKEIPLGLIGVNGSLSERATRGRVDVQNG